MCFQSQSQYLRRLKKHAYQFHAECTVQWRYKIPVYSCAKHTFRTHKSDNNAFQNYSNMLVQTQKLLSISSTKQPCANTKVAVESFSATTLCEHESCFQSFHFSYVWSNWTIRIHCCQCIARNSKNVLLWSRLHWYLQGHRCWLIKKYLQPHCRLLCAQLLQHDSKQAQTAIAMLL